MSIYEQISIAAAIREQLEALKVDDDTIHDTIEGECDVYECVDWLLNKLAEEDCSIEALESHIAKLTIRKERIKARKERWRELLLMAAQATGEKSIKRPCGSISVSQKPIGIASIDESKVPDCYFETVKKLDRAKLKADALANGVEGVTLDNGGVVLRVRI